MSTVYNIYHSGLLWPPRRAIGRREAILFCDGLLCFFLFLFLIFLYLNAESPRPLGTASPNFQGSRMGGWNRPSLSPIFKFLSWRGAGVEKVPKNVRIFVGLRNFSSGRGAQFIVNIFSPVRKVEKNWCPFTSGIPSRIEPCRVLCAILAGVTISRESSTFLD